MIHVHNGDVVAQRARRAGIPGEHLAYRESLATGPASRDLEARTAFLAVASGEPPLKIRNGLLTQEQTLREAAETDDEIVLWFEHDLFCAVNLLSVLDILEHAPNLSIVFTTEPLLQYDLTELFADRDPVPAAMRAAAASAWSAFTAPDPRLLHALFAVPESSFPFLGRALALHASRFPSLANGLGSFEQRLLAAVTDGAIDFLSLFQLFDRDAPRFGFGDVEVLRALHRLAERSVPLVTLSGKARDDLRVILTDAGTEVLAGNADDVALNEPHEWIGGVHLSRENVWRWNADAKEIVPTPPS